VHASLTAPCAGLKDLLEASQGPPTLCTSSSLWVQLPDSISCLDKLESLTVHIAARASTLRHWEHCRRSGS